MGISKLILALVLLLASTASVLASGYTFNNGLWWKNGIAYTRYRCTQRYGCCSYRYVWCYKQVVNQQTIIQYGPNWKEKLTDVIKAREDYQAYLQALRELGYGNQYNQNQYSQNQYSQYSSTDRGKTVAGFSVSAYGKSIDHGEIIRQSLALLDGLGRSAEADSARASEIRRGVTGAAVGILERQQNLAMTEAKIKGTDLILKRAAELASEFNIEGLRVDSDGGNTVSISSVPPTANISIASADDLTKWTASIFDSHGCVKCHSGDQPKGGLNLSDISTLTNEDGLSILIRTHADELAAVDNSKIMPPKDSSHAPLDGRERQVLRRAMNSEVLSRFITEYMLTPTPAP
jgi:cytochrome c551/c552